MYLKDEQGFYWQEHFKNGLHLICGRKIIYSSSEGIMFYLRLIFIHVRGKLFFNFKRLQNEGKNIQKRAVGINTFYKGKKPP